MSSTPYDDDEDLAGSVDEDLTAGLEAFDFSAPVVEDGVDHGLEAFDVFAPSAPAEAGDSTEPVFTVTNPPGTVTVSAYFDGRVRHVGLAPQAVETAEDELAAEIVVIAGLATQQARAAQFSYMLEGMQDHGHDTLDSRDFLARTVGLPSPADADAAQARVFATRYQGDHD